MISVFSRLQNCMHIYIVYIIFRFQMIPMAVLYGVFLYMGVSALQGVQLVQRVSIIFMPQKYQPDYVFLRHVPIRKTHLFTFIQIVCLAILWTIKSIKSISIIFPIMVGHVTKKYSSCGEVAYQIHRVKQLIVLLEEKPPSQRKQKVIKIIGLLNLDELRRLIRVSTGESWKIKPAASMPHFNDPICIPQHLCIVECLVACKDSSFAFFCKLNI